MSFANLKRQPLSMRTMGRDNRTLQTKEILTVAGYKGVLQPSSPAPFYGWVLVTEFDMRAEASGASREEVEQKLVGEIARLKEIVPARRAALSRIEQLIAQKFSAPYFGYLFLNGQQKEWRAASTMRLLELIAVLEELAEPGYPAAA